MVTFLINAVYTFLHYIINLFPSGSGFNSDIHNAVISLADYLHILDPLVPIDILLQCLLIIFGAEILIFGFKTFKWVVSHVPFVGGKGN